MTYIPDLVSTHIQPEMTIKASYQAVTSIMLHGVPFNMFIIK